MRVNAVKKLRPDILVVSFVIHLLALALPLAMLQIYDRILPAKSFGTASILMLGVGGAIILEALLRYGRSALFASLGARYEAEATLEMLGRLRRADLSAVEQRGGASISDAFRAIPQVRDFWSGQAGLALYELPFVFLYLALIAYVGGWLVLIPLVLFGGAILLARAMNGNIRAIAEIHEHADTTRNDFAWTVFAALDYFKASGFESGLARLWRGANTHFHASSAWLEIQLGKVRENANLIASLATVLVVAFGALEVIDGRMTTGALAACSMLAGRSIGPAMASLSYWAQLNRVSQAQQRIDAVLTLPDMPLHAEQAPQAQTSFAQSEIEIEAPALFRGTVRIAPGEVIHLDSPDAVQATRLLTTLSGMTEESDIHIRIDGQPLSAFDADAYRMQVMLVSQHLALVPGSVLDNLTLYDRRYNAAALYWSEQLGLQAWLDRLRYGVLTEVGPGTAEHLDEGLYQRVALIRALAREPRILLLDHAARGMDLDGLKRFAAVLQAQQGRTTVLLASFKAPLISACSRSLALAPRGVHAS